ncbi:integral membrane protein [Enterococcus casseliflavus]|nr:integral membrane protein [Enterococcus casseliflavus]
MSKNRIEAFTDAVIAIVMTLLVLELHQPEGDTFASFLGVEQQFIIYLISFVMLAIYWNNHHHLFQVVFKIDGWTLWANHLLILALTLFPFVTSWVSRYPVALAPQLLYGAVILLTDFSYFLVENPWFVPILTIKPSWNCFADTRNSTLRCLSTCWHCSSAG